MLCFREKCSPLNLTGDERMSQLTASGMLLHVTVLSRMVLGMAALVGWSTTPAQTENIYKIIGWSAVKFLSSPQDELLPHDFVPKHLQTNYILISLSRAHAS